MHRDQGEDTSQKINEVKMLLEQQLSPMNLKQIIENAIFPMINQVIISYISSNVQPMIEKYFQSTCAKIHPMIESYIQMMWKREIESLTEIVNQKLQQVNEIISRDPGAIRNFQVIPSGDQKEALIIEAIQQKRFSEALDMCLSIDDDNQIERYFEIINFSEVNEMNITQDTAYRAALWGIKRLNTTSLESMCKILTKGPQLGEIVRKIINARDPSLAVAKSIAIKRMM